MCLISVINLRAKRVKYEVQRKKSNNVKEEISLTVKRLAHEIVEKNFGVKNLAIVGVQTRGVSLAKRVIKEIKDARLAGGEKIFLSACWISRFTATMLLIWMFRRMSRKRTSF